MEYIANPVRVTAKQILEVNLIEEDFRRRKFSVLKLDDGAHSTPMQE